MIIFSPSFLPFSSAPSIHSLLAFAHGAGSRIFWLPAKLMSKCHPHATVIQISYFLPSLVQTSHPSRLSPSFTSSRQAPSVSFSVCCREASNEIHTKQDGRPDAFLRAFLSTFFSLSCLFFCLFSFHFLCFSIYPYSLFSPFVLQHSHSLFYYFSPWTFLYSPLFFVHSFLYPVFILLLLQVFSVSCSTIFTILHYFPASVPNLFSFII